MKRETDDARQARRLRKQALEARIERQRVDLMVESTRWHAATRSIDHAWAAVVRWKVPLYTVGGLLLVAMARKPGALTRIARRGLAGAFLVQRVRKAVSTFR